MTPLLRDTELQRQGITAAELQEKFKNQLNKDFELCGLLTYLETFSDFSYEGVHESLSKTLKQIMSLNFNAYLQLLYRIDISERHLKEKMKAEFNKPENEVLADLLIKRILQKVILKKIYSS